MNVNHRYVPDGLVPDLCVARDGSPYSVACGRPERAHPPADLASPEQHAQLRALWETLGLAGDSDSDRSQRLTLIARLLGIDFIASETDLGRGHAETLLARLAEYVQTPPEDRGALAAAIPRAWWTAPAPPVWVLGETREVGDWRNLGVRRWQGTGPDRHNPDVLLLVNAVGTGFVRFALDIAGEGAHGPDFVDRAFGYMQDDLDRRALPPCEGPDCPDKGALTFTAAEDGLLCGKPRTAGDRIAFCGRHYNDVYGVITGGPVPDWLAGDVIRPDPAIALEIAVANNDPAAAREALDRLLFRPETTA